MRERSRDPSFSAQIDRHDVTRSRNFRLTYHYLETLLLPMCGIDESLKSLVRMPAFVWENFQNERTVTFSASPTGQQLDVTLSRVPILVGTYFLRNVCFS